jgi:hypothetical protein
VKKMIALKAVKGQYIVTADGEQKVFSSMAAALRFVEAYHKSRASF